MSVFARTVTFNGDGSLIVEFVDDEHDIKSNGLVFNQVAFLPAEEYEDEIDAVTEAVRALIDSILADKTRLGAPEYAPPPEDDDD